MGLLTNHVIIQAPADTVWQVVGAQFDRIGEWATAIPASTAAPAGPTTAGAPVAGRVCHTGVRLVPHVTETIIGYDAAGRTLTYQASGMPAFVTTARNRWHITPIGDNASRVTYAGQFETRGIVGRLARWWILALINRTGRHVLDDLKHYIETGTPSPRKQRQLRHANQ
jgi:hypothetical protein